MTSNEKGAALERAVHAIEAMIIRETPGLRDAPFKMEPRKRMEVDGVTHEIDLFVTIALGTPYQSVHIFECKNWAKPVTKVEILDFAEKVRVTGAAKGFFIAREFTPSASAQAGVSDPRIVLTSVSDNLAGGIYADAFVTSEHMILHLDVSVTAYDRPIEEIKKVVAGVGTLRGRLLAFQNYLEDEAEQAVLSARYRQARRFALVGEHHDRISPAIVYEREELVVSGIEIAHVVLHILFSVFTRPCSVISMFDVGTRGRYFTVEGRSTGRPEMTVEMDIVQMMKPPPPGRKKNS